VLKIRRFGILASVGLAIALLVAGLPLSQFGLEVINAQYSYAPIASVGNTAEGACGGNSIAYQVALKADTPYYSSPTLSKASYLGVLQVSSATPYVKFLACDSTTVKVGTYFALYIGSANVVYISTANAVVEPRGQQGP